MIKVSVMYKYARCIYCDSVESFQKGFGPHAHEIMGDIPNYTDLAPTIQISEVVVGQP